MPSLPDGAALPQPLSADSAGPPIRLPSPDSRDGLVPRGFPPTAEGALAQLAATQTRFAAVQNEFRRFGMDIVAASVRRAQEQGYGADLDPPLTAAAIALLFENFTTVFVGASGLGVEVSDEDAIITLSRIWKKTLYGF